MRRSITTLIVAAVSALALSACEVPEEPAENKPDSNSAEAKKNNFTPAQQSAITAAKSYLDSGMGFSRFGLIRQLTSQAGSGFERRDAVFAIRQIHPNWNRQAVIAAKSYMSSGMGFSRDGLIRQLTSRSGSGFTQAQAEFAAGKVGL